MLGRHGARSVLFASTSIEGGSRGPATSMSREATLCLMVAADVTPVLSSPDSKPPAWAFVGDDASLAAHVRNAPNHRDRSTVATMYRPEHPWPHYSASGSGVPSSREAPSETRRPDRDWSCEPTSYRCSRPGVIDNRCHGAAENDAGQDAVRTESSRSIQTLPSIGSPRHRHPATTRSRSPTTCGAAFRSAHRSPRR